MVIIAQDKIEHWAFGFVLTLFYIVHPSLVYSGLIFGVGKEIYDHKYGKGADPWDLLATLAGVVTAWQALIFVF